MPALFATVARPETNTWKEFIEGQLLPTADTKAAVQVTLEDGDDPTARMRSLRTLFWTYGYGQTYKLHVRVEPDVLTLWVTRK